MKEYLIKSLYAYNEDELTMWINDMADENPDYNIISLTFIGYNANSARLYQVLLKLKETV